MKKNIAGPGKGKRAVEIGTAGAERGFTLLELLVALSIFALISVSLYGSLSSMLATKEQLEADSEKLRELQTTMRIIGRDIEQAVDRPIRTYYQMDPRDAMMWTEIPAVFELTTSGRRNPLLLKRSSLQRVSYRLEDESLIKDSWPVLDRGVETQPFSQVLLREVEGFELSFKDSLGTTCRQWPPDNPALSPDNLPKAVQVHLDLKKWGRIDRLFLVAGKG
ncbi:MAG: type II secretion system minor pseudopilin GspJ [Desulfurivibrionaceae bacterium]|nr:type II secretion system minor pseudopilin GspJ [Desulfobulbales bacterium]MDT8334074.1 type II secretion system minor pseudopilin GspJ [Desulfurivibrionaceae bacterium]